VGGNGNVKSLIEYQKRIASGEIHGPRWKGDDHPRVPWHFREMLIATEGNVCQWPYCFYTHATRGCRNA
jgi:hypothetical protein